MVYEQIEMKMEQLLCSVSKSNGDGATFIVCEQIECVYTTDYTKDN